ncbi:hypothetical protein G6F46_015271 [Rhizopus delemar]|nr:hypothetical protein G6F54_014222 [Rhizopus delemar]KAG1481034.1 hypothetical protein G6F53_014169 [Rhizopus delemar]KAG1530725.1 hypothetical protein G6F49_013856 [Rhizopus delemar]KAG1565440.1 hypothetical protein G6F48_013798 [Rhizopus delemar]KAG1566181.1 hypothetical protein G6F47_013875 [Rhizopus delemar]
MSIPPNSFVNANGTTPPPVHVVTDIGESLQVRVPEGLPLGRASSTRTNGLVKSTIDSRIEFVVKTVNGRCRIRRAGAQLLKLVHQNSRERTEGVNVQLENIRFL